jgi:MoxR-like ATPase
MFYISNEALKKAVAILHQAGSHEHFRNYLVLKAHGLKYGNRSHIAVDTKNLDPALKLLFEVTGLPEGTPFYNPMRNELLKKDTGRGVIQTAIKKYYDEAVKTKMKWPEVYQSEDKKWQVRFSPEYPESLGRGLAGMAEKEDKQISVDPAAFAIWIERDCEWPEKPPFEQLWTDAKKKLNFTDVETDLLFTRNFRFTDDPFVTLKPDRTELSKWITETEEPRGGGQDVLKPPSRQAFSPEKMRRIVLSQRVTGVQDAWWLAQDTFQEAQSILAQTGALLLIGPPGTGKTRLAFQLAEKLLGGDETRRHLFQFHASYAYEDFIQALTPKPDDKGLRFDAVLKRFAKACEAAENAEQVVILDEFNRADVSKVFGEAFLLIEKSYRDKKYAIPYLYDENKFFWIPSRLYVIATLNNIDKSTFELDFALRRRFGELYVSPDSNLLEEIVKRAGCEDEDFIRILRSAFAEVQNVYPLGHAYFKSVFDRKSLIDAYRRVIRPTVASFLGEYRKTELSKVDSIVKRAVDSSNWNQYIEVEETD